MPKGIKGVPPAQCHPDKPHYGKGLCYKCWNKEHRQQSHVKATKKQYRESHDPWPRSREYLREQKLKSKFGLTKEEYDKMVEAQKGVCAICGRPPVWGFEHLAVDHDHKTKKNRGLLCHPCNSALGLFQDSPEILDAAKRYLIENSTS